MYVDGAKEGKQKIVIEPQQAAKRYGNLINVFKDELKKDYSGYSIEVSISGVSPRKDKNIMNVLFGGRSSYLRW